jgi:hypothetical protein
MNFETTLKLVEDITYKLCNLKFEELGLDMLSDIIVNDNNNHNDIANRCNPTLTIMYLNINQLECIVRNLQDNIDEYDESFKSIIDNRIMEFWLLKLKDVLLTPNISSSPNANIPIQDKSIIDKENPNSPIKKMNRLCLKIEDSRNFIENYCKNNKLYEPIWVEKPTLV